MATFTRRNAWNNNGTFDNTDLLWYAKGVGAMQARSLDDQTSWWFFAAIHGQFATNDVNSGSAPPTNYPNWSKIAGPPSVPITPLPSTNLKNKYWDQCQHGTWFFPPWHRGYLYALEEILRDIIKGLGGPGDWALPYWNYFGPGDQYQIPPAFTLQTLPDGSPNPLFVNVRFGPNNDKKIFIPLASWDITQDCQKNTEYTGAQPDYYGGGETGFDHSGYTERGDLEDNPHNIVHVAIGGQNPATGRGGLMSIPNTAALDPIFYLHHCNIDRMWASWTADGNKNPDDSLWLNGPTTTGDRKFYMPKPDKTDWQYTPDMVKDTHQLYYTYDDLSLGVSMLMASKKAMRLRNFGVPSDELKTLSVMASNVNTEIVGANQGTISLDASGARTTVQLDPGGWNTVTKSLNKALTANAEGIGTASDLPDEVYLQLEGIKGDEDSIVCSVSVNQQYAGHISLFGLRNASVKDGHHGGAGLTIRLNISKIVDSLQLNNAMNINSLDVLIQPVNIVAEGNELTIDRVSVYRKGQ